VRLPLSYCSTLRTCHVTGLADRPEPCIRIVFSSASSGSETETSDVPDLGAEQCNRTCAKYIEDLDVDEDATSGADDEVVTPPEDISPASALFQRLYGHGVPDASGNSPPGSPHSHGSMIPTALPRDLGRGKAEDPVDAMLAASLMLPPVMELRGDVSDDADDERPIVPPLDKTLLATPPTRRCAF
jgi:hypothetical protein